MNANTAVIRATKGRPITITARNRTAARRRTKIEALFNKMPTERLAELWQRLCPFPLDPDCELADRRGMIKDLADFGLVLQPNLEGLDTEQLWWLVDTSGRGCQVAVQAHEHLGTSPNRSFRDKRRYFPASRRTKHVGSESNVGRASACG